MTGNCNAFDDGANGYCRADAIGSVILKRLEDAEADRDPIFGVIVGSTTNHCGQTDSITRPHEGDQSSVFRRIMRYTNYDPLDVGYIEMHVSVTLDRLVLLFSGPIQALSLSVFSFKTLDLFADV
jgi:acyl transferase domain-containing protein